MKLSRDWLGDYIDLSDLSDDDVTRRMTEIGHPLEALERHGDDSVFDVEITTNRVDAMSHLGMARELAAALGRDVRNLPAAATDLAAQGSVTIRIDAPEMCRRYSAVVIRNVVVKPSPPEMQRRLEEVGLRPINNVVDATNYVMLSVGHPLHAFDLDKLANKTIIVRRGKAGESIKSLDGETRALDADTAVIADGERAVALAGVIGGANSEITDATRDVMLECAWFTPTFIRRTARRLGIKTDASYRFERGMDPNGTLPAIELAARLIVANGGGTREPVLDVVAEETTPRVIELRSDKLHEASGGAVGIAYALELFRRMGFGAEQASGGLRVVVPTYRGDIHEEMDLIEEVLRFFGFNNVPSVLPRVTTGDVRQEPVEIAETAIRDLLVGSGLSEAVNYSFIHPAHNALFSDERPIALTNALSENVASMRLSLLPGLLETVAFNRSYGTRDGALFEVGRTYHRDGDGVREHHRVAFVMFGAVGSFWGDAKRPVDFFDIKGIVEQVAAKLHVPLEFAAGDAAWLRKGRRAVARHGDRTVAAVGFLAPEVLSAFGLKGDVAAAELDVDALLAIRDAKASGWTMAPVARYPGVPMILALTHGRDLEYQRIIDAIRSFDVPFLQEVGLRDRFTPEADDVVKTTLGMWYQAFDRSLTQEEVAAAHESIGSRIAAMLPVNVLSS